LCRKKSNYLLECDPTLAMGTGLAVFFEKRRAAGWCYLLSPAFSGEPLLKAGLVVEMAAGGGDHVTFVSYGIWEFEEVVTTDYADEAGLKDKH
jgi:hypothetical protein